MRSVALTALILAAAFVFPIRAAETDSAGHDLFTSQVRPILARHCFKCHGPDDKARKAHLRLDVHGEAVKPAASGAIAIVPGKPDESELVSRIFADDAGERMPPAATKNPLSEADKQVLKRWIAGGAEYKTHWAFIPPRPGHPPQVRPRELGPKRHRFVHHGPSRGGRADALGNGGPRDLDPASLARFDRFAPDARGCRGIPP